MTSTPLSAHKMCIRDRVLVDVDLGEVGHPDVVGVGGVTDGLDVGVQAQGHHGGDRVHAGGSQQGHNAAAQAPDVERTTVNGQHAQQAEDEDEHCLLYTSSE